MILKLNRDLSLMVKLLKRNQIYIILLILGQINPINVTNISISIYKETKTGLELLKSFVAENNKFKVGPLVDSFTYQIVATKENYKFHQNIEKGQENSMNVVLTAQRLSSLKIKIKDENGVAIPNVLIFISSTSKKNLIRMNNYTNSEVNNTLIL